MNAKLTEQEYQWMIIELIGQSIEHIEKLRQDSNEDYVDWIYLIERLKLKGILSDLRPARSNVNSKADHAAKMIRLQFDNEQDKTITTMV